MTHNLLMISDIILFVLSNFLKPLRKLISARRRGITYSNRE